MSVLYIDVGNSEIKWCLGLPDSVHRHGRQSSLSENFEALAENPKRVYISSVATDEFNARLAAYCVERWACSPTYACVVDGFAGLNLAYDEISTLGVDRWLAMLAGRAEFSAQRFLIVDAGSAITADVVSIAEGHEGGYIAPGLPLMQGVFNRDADRIRLGALTLTSSLSAGRSTLGCVQSGVTAMLVGFVQQIVRQQKVDLVVWAGGLGASIKPLCIALVGGSGAVTVQQVLRPNLVLDGLSLLDKQIV